MSVQCDDIKSNWVIAGIIPYTALGPFIKRERKMFLDVAALKYHLFASRAEVYIPSWGEEGQPHLCHASVWIQFVVSEVQMEAVRLRRQRNPVNLPALVFTLCAPAICRVVFLGHLSLGLTLRSVVGKLCATKWCSCVEHLRNASVVVVRRISTKMQRMLCVSCSLQYSFVRNESQYQRASGDWVSGFVVPIVATLKQTAVVSYLIPAVTPLKII